MRYSLYNVIIYDGVNAMVSKFILNSDEQQGMYDLKKFWTNKGYDGEILKIDLLYGLDIRSVLAMTKISENKHIIDRFEEMYF